MALPARTDAWPTPRATRAGMRLRIDGHGDVYLPAHLVAELATGLVRDGATRRGVRTIHREIETALITHGWAVRSTDGLAATEAFLEAVHGRAAA